MIEELKEVDGPSEACECCGAEICRECGKPELVWEVARIINKEPHGMEVKCKNCNLHVKRTPEIDVDWIDAHELMNECSYSNHDI